MQRFSALRHSVAIATLALILLLPANVQAAYVDSDYIPPTQMENGYGTYFTFERTTNASPYRISFAKYSGPNMDVAYYGSGLCTGSGVAGNWISYPNSTGNKRLRETSSFGITFCLAVFGFGGTQYSTFSGEVSWWRA